MKYRRQIKMLFMCYVEGRESPKKQHANADEAYKEAARLARLPENIGREVHVLLSLNSCKVNPSPVVWKFETGEIPNVI
jgi:hypothetical protein